MSMDTYATGSLLGSGGKKKKNGRNLFFWVIFVLVTDQLRKDWSHEASLYLILENKKLRKMVMITRDQHCLWERGRPPAFLQEGSTDREGPVGSGWSRTSWAAGSGLWTPVRRDQGAALGPCLTYS